jgi:hypothetical protein
MEKDCGMKEIYVEEDQWHADNSYNTFKIAPHDQGSENGKNV